MELLRITSLHIVVLQALSKVCEHLCVQILGVLFGVAMNSGQIAQTKVISVYNFCVAFTDKKLQQSHSQIHDRNSKTFSNQ